MSLHADPNAAVQVSRAIRALGGPGRGLVLGYYPVARLNPFQAMLYSRAHAKGVAPVALRRPSELAALEGARQFGTQAALHLHWTSNVLARAKDVADAERQAYRFLHDLRQLKGLGIRLLWTIHNVLPHHCPFPDVEASMRQALLDLIDLVHIMAPETMAETAPFYRIPTEKVIEVPHPSYLGAYPTHYDVNLARFDLGYDPSDLVLGVIGSIQPYKGIDEFAASTQYLLADMPSLRGVVAGIPGTDEGSRQLLSRLDNYVHLDVHARILDPDQLSLLLTSFDAVVLPYLASLNSGAALLALSFGKPIIAPRIGHFQSLLDAGLGIGYNAEDPDGLTEALRELPRFLGEFDPGVAISYCERISASRISERFVTLLLDRLNVA